MQMEAISLSSHDTSPKVNKILRSLSVEDKDDEDGKDDDDCGNKIDEKLNDLASMHPIGSGDNK